MDPTARVKAMNLKAASTSIAPSLQCLEWAGSMWSLYAPYHKPRHELNIISKMLEKNKSGSFNKHPERKALKKKTAVLWRVTEEKKEDKRTKI
jgi:hypothetical protein